MKALYAVSRMHEWTDISKRLKDRYNIEPVYWIHSNHFKAEITKLYPDAVFHDTASANKAIPAYGITIEEYLVDKEVIIKLMETERDFYIMLNRHDMDQSFTYNERKDLYYDQLAYWLYVIKNLKIEIVIFSETPHALSHFIIYSICKLYNIKTIMLSFTTFPGLLYAKNSFYDVPEIPIDSNKTRVRKILKNEMESMGEGKHNPWYMKEQEEKNKKKESFRQHKIELFHSLKYFLERVFIRKPKSYKIFYKKRGMRFQESFYTKSEYVFITSRNKKQLNKFKNRYRALCQKPDLSTNYIYFPLHYQPERSSCPEGSVYSDQKLVVNLLSSLLPNGWKIYIKEHPSQFMMKRGLLGRSEYYYEDILKNKNVALINDTFSSFELTEKAKAVVTLTGTAGFEAIVSGIPALIFGYAWYRELPGAFYIENISDIVKAFRKIQDGDLPDKDKTIKAVFEMEKFFFLGYLASGNEKAIEISYEDHVDELYKGFVSLLNESEKGE